MSTGVGVAVGTAVWAAATQKLAYPLDIARLGLNLETGRIEAALRLFCATEADLKVETERLDGALEMQWSFNAFGRYPVVRLDEERLLVLSPRLLLDRVFGWLPLFDLMTGLRAQGRGPAADRAKLWFERLCEADALEALANLMPSGAGTRRFFDEGAIQAAFGRSTPCRVGWWARRWPRSSTTCRCTP